MTQRLVVRLNCGWLENYSFRFSPIYYVGIFTEWWLVGESKGRDNLKMIQDQEFLFLWNPLHIKIIIGSISDALFFLIILWKNEEKTNSFVWQKQTKKLHTHAYYWAALGQN